MKINLNETAKKVKSKPVKSLNHYVVLPDESGKLTIEQVNMFVTNLVGKH